MHLHSLDLQQTITDPTHEDGHTIDLVISRQGDGLLKLSYVSSQLSDHCMVHAILNVSKPSFPSKRVTYRKYGSIDIAKFKEDISNTDMVHNPASSVDELVSQYNHTLKDLLDRHAPEKSRVVVDRPLIPWFTDEIRQAKRRKRKLEKQMRRTGLVVHREMFKTAKLELRVLMEVSKSHFYNGKITDSKSMFKVVDTLLHRNSSMLPSHDSKQSLTDRFAEFFKNKIDMIRTGIDSEREGDHAFEHESCVSSLRFFTPLSKDEVSKLINSLSSASCDSDPISTSLVKHCIDVMLSTITRIVNLSLECGVFPSALKSARVGPLLKKPTLDPEQFKSYRPVSNLPFISKVVEKAVALRLNTYMHDNGLNEKYQSAYKQHHSTETALLCVSNSILRCVDEKRAVLLVLLDLSAAFDTVDHDVLLDRMCRRLGIHDISLSWFRSYLCDRCQAVQIDGCVSRIMSLQWGVPQGSVLGPLLFSIYSEPICDIARKHGINIHTYADDTQLYLSFDASADMSICIGKMEKCVCEIKEWMKQNMLKLNDDKTEVLVMSTPYFNSRFRGTQMKIGDADVQVNDSARNLGVIFDNNLDMSDHIRTVCRASFMQLRNISSIKGALTRESLERVIHAFISSRLDYCNSLLYGLPRSSISKLQRIQNAAARMLTGTRKYDHITPVLKSLHWLPVEKRIDFKVLLLTYRALHDRAPDYIRDILQDRTNVRTLRSTVSHQLSVPRNRLKGYGDRSFSSAAPKLWNALPAHVTGSTSVNIFKKRLKTHLFTSAFN